MTIEAELKLDKWILDKAIKSGNEYGWRLNDFKDVIENAEAKDLAIIGGQIQFHFPDGTCELYWLTYDTSEVKSEESWIDYRKRTKKECIEQFDRLVETTDFEKVGLENFDFLKIKKQNGFNILDYMICILYFKDNAD
jgi:hypothetical protein